MENEILNNMEYDRNISLVIEKLKNQAPSNSFIKLILEEDDFGYKVKCKIVSKLETFSGEVISNSFLEAIQLIESKMLYQLSEWKAQRDFNYFQKHQDRA